MFFEEARNNPNHRSSATCHNLVLQQEALKEKLSSVNNGSFVCHCVNGRYAEEEGELGVGEAAAEGLKALKLVSVVVHWCRVGGEQNTEINCVWEQTFLLLKCQASQR